MTNGEGMTKEYSSPNDESLSAGFGASSGFVLRHLSLIRNSVIRHSSFLLLLFPLTLHGADNLGLLGSKPKRDVLEHYQETITHDEFPHLINDLYCRHQFASDSLHIHHDTAH